MTLSKYALLSTLLMALPISAFAQCGNAPETTSSATMVISGQNSPARTYAIKNLSISASANFSGYGRVTRDMGISLALLAPPDATMLQWMKQGGPDSTKKVVITVSSKDANGAASEMKYVLDAARIMSFSAFHPGDTSGEFMLQIAATNLTINGVSD